MKDTYEKICLLANDCFDLLDKPLKEETTIEDLGGDSVDVLNLSMSIEDEFDIEITEAEFIKKFDDAATLGDIVNFIESKKG